MQDEVERIAASLTEAQAIEAARKFLQEQLAKTDTVLAPAEYYRALASIVAAIPPFKRPKFHTFGVEQTP